MNTRTMIILPAVAIAVGATAGALAATGSSTRPAPAANAPIVSAAAVPAVPSIPIPPTRGGGRLVDPGSIRLVARTADPHGGPPWAIRMFRGRETYNGHAKGRWRRCGQLGRVVGGRFGWIVAGSTVLQPLGLDNGWSTRCEPMTLPGDRNPAPGAERPQAFGQWSLETLVSRPLGPVPHLAGTVAWGIVRAGSRDARAWIAPDRSAAQRAAGGAVIVFGPSSAHRADLVVRARTVGGSLSSARPLAPRAQPLPAPMRGVLPPSGPATGRDLRVVARAGDPAGGPPLAIARGTLGGRACVSSPGTLVDDQVGQVVPGFGLFDATTGCGPLPKPTAAEPFSLGQTASSGTDRSELPIAAAVQRARAGARRTTVGQQTVMYGSVLPGIVRVQISTPSDVRTLLPGTHHAILAVWDIPFRQGERATLTGTFADGRTVTRRVRLAGFS